MENDGQNMMVINLSQIKLPIMKENKYKDWVTYGEDDGFGYYLQDLMNNSSIHGSILDSKTRDTLGSGLTYKKSKDTKTDNFLENANPDESADEILEKLSYDYNLYGGYSFLLVMNKGMKTYSMYHIDFNKIRCGKKDQYGKINEYYYSNDWKNYRKDENKPVVYPAYKEGSKEINQIVWYSGYKPGISYYPLPQYVGALSYLEVDKEIANFHLSHIKNGMTPNIVFSFNNGEPTPDKRKELERDIIRKYMGTDNAGKFILLFNKDKEHSPEITVLSPSQLDKQFIQLQSTAMQNILISHKITSPMLVGIKTEGQLGGANELETAHTVYQNDVIKPIQKTILKAFNLMSKLNGLQELYIEPTKPLEFSWSEDVLKMIMTQNEMREKVGLAPIEIPEQNNVIGNE